MSCRARTVLLTVLVASLGGLAWLVWIPRVPDPVFEGKPLSRWLWDYADDHIYKGPADRAVRHIGTNAIPLLLTMLRAKDSKVTLTLRGLAEKQHLMEFHYDRADWLNYIAAGGMVPLGSLASNASYAVPDLIRAYDPKGSWRSQVAIICALGCIGPAAKDAVPLLLRVLATNTEAAVLKPTVFALGSVHPEPGIAVPALTNLLHASGVQTRYFAAEALGRLGLDARPATASLLELLRDPNSDVRKGAFNALKAIDSEAAAKAGIK